MKYIISKKTTGPLYITESDDIKMNYRCKAEEQNGTGPGSCGGSKGKDNIKPTKSLSIYDSAIDKIVNEIEKADKDYKSALAKGDRKSAAKFESDRDELKNTRAELIKSRAAVSDKSKSSEVPKKITVPSGNIKSITHLGKDIKEEDSNKSVMTEQEGRNRFVVTSADGKKYAFRDKDFAKLAMDRLNSGKQIDDIIKRHDELYKTIGNAPRERINPETGLPTMMKDGYEMEYSTEGGKKIWKRTARDLRKV